MGVEFYDGRKTPATDVQKGCYDVHLCAALNSHRINRHVACASSHFMTAYEDMVKCTWRAGEKGEWAAVTFVGLCHLTRNLHTRLDYPYGESMHLHPATTEQLLSTRRHKRRANVLKWSLLNSWISIFSG